MKKTLVLALAISALFTTACSGKKITKGDTSLMDTLSYCIGADMGMTVNHQFAGMNVDLNLIKSGLEEGMLEKSDVTPEAALDLLQEFFTRTLRDRQAEYEAKKAADSTLVFVPFVNDKEKNEISYAIGVNAGDGLRASDLTIQYYWLLKAFDDARDEKLALNEQQMSEYMQHYFTVVRPAEAKARSEKWLEKKAKSSGVQKTESGLLYKVIEQGDMTLAARDNEDIVTIYFVGKLQDGKVFEATRFNDRSEDQKKMLRKQYPTMFDEKGNPIKEDEPAKVTLSRTFKGWNEGLKLVGPGGKIKLYIPAELAFGTRGSRTVGPNEAVEYEVEVVSVVSAAAATERSEKWLAAKALEDGVQKTESGLLYSIIDCGNMKKAAKKDEDIVKVYYVGKLQDGKEFDARRATDGEPIEFPLNRVIKGWTEGMKLVGPGGKIKLYIPAELAYGKTGAGNEIGPNEALEFEVELVDVTPAKKK